MSAFLDMDRRQSIASLGVDASAQLAPEKKLAEKWASTEKLCFDAGAAYLAAVDQFDGILTPAARTAFDNATRMLAGASAAVDTFYETYRPQLEHAASVLSATPRLAENAIRAADSARLTVDEQYADYPSVRDAWNRLNTATHDLDAAAGHAVRVREAATAVHDAAAALEQATAAAPGRARDAEHAVASVRTRIDAVRTRSERIAPAFSTLLREFNAASSADLSHNERNSARHIEQADEDLRAARAAAGRSPEEALRLVAEARGHLHDAEELVDAVTERVDLLRQVKQNPQATEDAVRFKLRDAQQLAVNRKMVAEWGSVLDAQLARIERARSALTGTHPDYWSYVQDLDTISTFIAGVIERLRNSAR